MKILKALVKNNDDNNIINRINNFMLYPSMPNINYNNMNYSLNQPMGMFMKPPDYSSLIAQALLSQEEREYYNFCRDLSFIYHNQITVKVNQKFAERFENNYTINPQFWKDIPSIQSKDEGIELIETRLFYPHPRGMMVGDTVTPAAPKATKKGKFKIKHQKHTAEANVIE